MVVFEFEKKNAQEAMELQAIYKDAICVNVDSLSGDDLIQIIIPVAILMRSLSPLIIKLIETNKCKIKYDGFELENVPASKLLNVIEEIKEKRKKK